MKNVAISRRYANALMLIAREDSLADTYRSELDEFSQLMSREQDLVQAISNPLFDRADRLKVLESVLEKSDLTKVMKSFLSLLFAKGRIGFVSDINAFFQKLADEDKGIARASVVSAAQLSPEAVEKIRSSLSGLTGKEVVLDVAQDSGLIGGVVTKIGDLVLDGSVKTQLLSMRESFKKGESV